MSYFKTLDLKFTVEKTDKKMVKEMNRKMHKSEIRLKEQRDNFEKKLKIRREMRMLKQENQKLMSEKFKMLEKIRKDQIMSDMSMYFIIIYY